jgi:hypothetical protein
MPVHTHRVISSWVCESRAERMQSAWPEPWVRRARDLRICASCRQNVMTPPPAEGFVADQTHF